MAWTNAAWEEQPTYATQRAMLIQFRTELRNAMAAKQGADGVFYDPTTIQMLLAQTDKDLVRINALVDAQNGVGVPKVVPTYSPRGAY